MNSELIHGAVYDVRFGKYPTLAKWDGAWYVGGDSVAECRAETRLAKAQPKVWLFHADPAKKIVQATQGRRLIEILKRRPMTSMQLQMLGISTCWWVRVRESLRPDEKLISGYVGDKKIKRYTVTRA